MSSSLQPSGSGTKRATDDPVCPPKNMAKGKRKKNSPPQNKPKKGSTPDSKEKSLTKRKTYAKTPDTDVAHRSEDSSIIDVATTHQNLARDTADTGTEPTPVEAETSPDTDVAHRSEDNSMTDVATTHQNLARDTADTGTEPTPVEAETSPDTDVAHRSEDNSMTDVATTHQNLARDTADTGTEPKPVEAASSSPTRVVEYAHAHIDRELENLLLEFESQPPTPDEYVVQIANAVQFEQRFDTNIQSLVRTDMLEMPQIEPVPMPASQPVLLGSDVPEVADVPEDANEPEEAPRLAQSETEDPAPEDNEPAV